MTLKTNRRAFLESASTVAAALTVVPRHILGGKGYIAPNDKIAFAYIGCGTQGLREMVQMLTWPEVQIVAVCDPNRDSNNYVDFSKDDVRSRIARLLNKPDWRKDQPGIPGGRNVAKEVVETYYADQRAADHFKGCSIYADFRELLEKEKEIDAVKIMTPDHLHATIAIAAMKKGKRAVTHKPLANRLLEARLVIETARKAKVGTHFLPANNGALIRAIKEWIDDGTIGTLREVHNWSSRPMWPHFAAIPADMPPIPEGFDWTLWLGPSLDRPYHPNYTHCVFRGWYEFGAGALADMGHYSLWSVFREFNLDSPYCVESRPSHQYAIADQVSGRLQNDYSFPVASTIRFKFAAVGSRAPLEIFWYDGSMKPQTPEEMEKDDKELATEGMMFVGDKGKIVAGFRGENPQLIPEQKMREYRKAKNLPEPTPRDRERQQRPQGTPDWLLSLKEGKPTYGDFLLAQPISDAVNLASISMRLGGKRLHWDAASVKITNIPDANKYLTREYRKGWELTSE